MNGMASIGSIIFLLGALVLVWHGLRGQHLPKQKLIKFALVWAAIIVGLVVILRVVIPG